MAGKAINKGGRPPKYPKLPGQARSVHRFQMAIRPDIFAALEKFRADQPFKVERSAVFEGLMEQFLIEKGYLPKKVEVSEK